METQEYNGWTNRETWATMLHIDNDEGLQETIYEMARNTVRDFDGEPDSNDGLWTLEESVKEFIENVLDYPNVQTNYGAFLMLTDIGSLYRVNWREIAESLLQNAKESVNA